MSANRCWASDETCIACICDGLQFIPPIKGVVCNCEGTGCSNEGHREHCEHGTPKDRHCEACAMERYEETRDDRFDIEAQDDGYADAR